MFIRKCVCKYTKWGRCHYIGCCDVAILNQNMPLQMCEKINIVENISQSGEIASIHDRSMLHSPH